MLADVRRGAPTLEWSHLSGYLQELARARGRHLPLQDMLEHMVVHLRLGLQHCDQKIH
jgi:ketopantoate reductase